MSDHRNTRRARCEQFAPLLAVLDPATGSATDTPEMAEARAHLADCPYCQADQRDYVALDSAVRSAFGSATAAPFRAAELLVAIGATSEPHRAGDPIRSVRYLKDFDDMEEHTTMPDTDERELDGATRVATAMAPISSRASRGAGFRRQALTLGFSATAVAAVLIVVAVSLFGAHWRPTGSHLARNSATQTTSLPANAGAGITAISMDSATDGWALGDATLDPTDSPTNVGVAFYHYDGHVWRFTQRIGGLTVYGAQPARIQVFTPSNAWAYVSGPNEDGPILHYDGVSWKLAPVTITGGEQLVRLEGFQMTAPTEGWAAAYLTGGSAGPGALGFLHYDGQRWTVEPNAFAPSGMNMSMATITGFSALPGIVWAVGTTYIQQSGNLPSVGLIFHRINGIWTLFRQLNSPNANQGISLSGIDMLNGSSGYAIGSIEQAQKQFSGSMVYSPMAQLWRYSFGANGPDWTPVNVPVAGPGLAGEFTQIWANSDHDLWITGLYSGSVVYRSGFQSNSLLLHYDGSSWTQVTPTVDIGKTGTGYISAIGLAPNGDLWAAGYYHSVADTHGPVQPLIWRYSGGKWSVDTIITK